MDIVDACIMYYFDRCLISMGKGILRMIHTHMGMRVNPYPPVYMGDPMGLFFVAGME
jgi:hypothetical protein